MSEAKQTQELRQSEEESEVERERDCPKARLGLSGRPSSGQERRRAERGEREESEHTRSHLAFLLFMTSP